MRTRDPNNRGRWIDHGPAQGIPEGRYRGLFDRDDGAHHTNATEDQERRTFGEVILLRHSPHLPYRKEE